MGQQDKERIWKRNQELWLMAKEFNCPACHKIITALPTRKMTRFNYDCCCGKFVSDTDYHGLIFGFIYCDVDNSRLNLECALEQTRIMHPSLDEIILDEILDMDNFKSFIINVRKKVSLLEFYS